MPQASEIEFFLSTNKNVPYHTQKTSCKLGGERPICEIYLIFLGRCNKKTPICYLSTEKLFFSTQILQKMESFTSLERKETKLFKTMTFTPPPPTKKEHCLTLQFLNSLTLNKCAYI